MLQHLTTTLWILKSTIITTSSSSASSFLFHSRRRGFQYYSNHCCVVGSNNSHLSCYFNSRRFAACHRSFTNFRCSNSSSDNHNNSMKGQRVEASHDSLMGCALRLREGNLVAFPTETVYVSSEVGSACVCMYKYI